MTRTGWFIYNGFDTRSLGLTVVSGDIDSAPARNFLVHAHGGANGDFVVDTGRFDNVPRTYTIMIRGNFRATYDALCNALLPMKGYQRLTDMWAPDEYFMAYLSGPLEPTVSPDEDRGTVLVSFTRQPQRWLVSGEQFVSLLAQTRFVNSTAYKVYPVFKLVINKEYSLDRVTSRSFTFVWFRSGYQGTTWTSLDFDSVDKAKEVLAASEALFVNCALGSAYTDTGADITRALLNGQGGDEYIPPNTTAVITQYGSSGADYLFLDKLIQFQQYTI